MFYYPIRSNTVSYAEMQAVMPVLEAKLGEKLPPYYTLVDIASRVIEGREISYKEYQKARKDEAKNQEMNETVLVFKDLLIAQGRFKCALVVHAGDNCMHKLALYQKDGLSTIKGLNAPKRLCYDVVIDNIKEHKSYPLATVSYGECPYCGAPYRHSTYVCDGCGESAMYLRFADKDSRIFVIPEGADSLSEKTLREAVEVMTYSEYADYCARYMDRAPYAEDREDAAKAHYDSVARSYRRYIEEYDLDCDQLRPLGSLHRTQQSMNNPTALKFGSTNKSSMTHSKAYEWIREDDELFGRVDRQFVNRPTTERTIRKYLSTQYSQGQIDHAERLLNEYSMFLLSSDKADKIWRNLDVELCESCGHALSVRTQTCPECGCTKHHKCRCGAKLLNSVYADDVPGVERPIWDGDKTAYVCPKCHRKLTYKLFWAAPNDDARPERDSWDDSAGYNNK